MSNNSSSQDLKDSELKNSATIKIFYNQMKTLSDLLKNNSTIDQLLLVHFSKIQTTALIIINELNIQKDKLLKTFDGVLLPIAEEVFVDLLNDAENLKIDLDTTLKNINDATKKNWIEYANNWKHLCNQCQNRKILLEAVLIRITDRNKTRIDRDIKIIDDYQKQVLSYFPEESEEFLDIKERLRIATQESLKKFIELKRSPEEASVKQIADWMVNIHQKREKYFDQVLMKIDSTVKGVIRINVLDDQRHYPEIEDEITFMEKELHHINELIAQLNLTDQKSVSSAQATLDGLKEHLDELKKPDLPIKIQNKINKLDNMIAASLFRIKGL